METAIRRYQIGGFLLAIDAPPFRESVYLTPFRCEKGEPDLLFRVRPGHPLLPPSAHCLSRELHSGIYLADGVTYRVLYQENSEQLLLICREASSCLREVCLDRNCLNLWDSNLVMKLLDLPELFLRRNAIFLHASFVVYNESAILFTAPKQTGKSTQAALWEKYAGAEIINGDRALLCCVQGKWMAFGSPYCGTSQICKNGSYPIGAIVLLGQGKENQLRPAKAREAAAAFLDGCTFDPERQTEQVLDLALDILQKLPILHFTCLPDKSAVHCLREALSI